MHTGFVSDYTFRRYIFDATHGHTFWPDADSKMVLYYSLNSDWFNVSYPLDNEALDQVVQKGPNPGTGLQTMALRVGKKESRAGYIQSRWTST